MTVLDAEREANASAQQALLEVLREDRAAQAASHTQTTALLTTLMEGVKSQAELARKHLDMFTSPGKPVVRIMTEDMEAAYERDRKREKARDAVGTPTPMDMDKLLAQLSDDFAQERTSL
ncbi:MAG: hypothetical protein IT456_24035 [Planctomycetes bacterium]|nr:hypothetical protein [Planctomycetota bacterium]